MPGTTKERNRKKTHREDDDRTLRSLKQELKPHNPNKKVTKCLNTSNLDVNLKRKKIVKKAILQKSKTSKKKQLSLSGSKRKPSAISTKENETTDEADVKRHGRSRKKRKKNGELDEASRLQRRTRYLLVKIKLEQNLIDAYSTEGWKGQSREKIRPEKELQRAMKQILMSKLGIREALHQLDMLSSEGRINDSVVASDGSVHHEHIVCAKCRLREAFPDNDIILCDGSCNRAFHQKCLDPPLSTENIPPGDEGWFCKFCKNKMEILEATNAHLGTHFPLECNWQEVFKEEANLPDDGNSMLCLQDEWPSEDSEDDDYDPDRIQTKGSDNMSKSESESLDSSSSFLGSLEDEAGIVGERINGSFDNNSHDLVGVDSEDDELVCHPRQRANVDYIKLYDEMFGKNATEYEQISDDEDWGPRKRKRKVKETDAAASTLVTLGGPVKKNSEEMPSETKETKRPIFRLPCNAVEKLKLVFAENELPERAMRLSLSKQIGLEFNKVNKWFKNARYLALKARKQAGRAQEDVVVSPCIQNEPISETTKGDHPDQTAPDSPKNLESIVKRKKTHFPTNSCKIKQRKKPLLHTADLDQMTMDRGDDVSLKHLREKAKEDKRKSSCHSRGDLLEAEAEMERLCEIKSRVEKLQQVLLQFPGSIFGKSGGIKSNDPSVIFVPVAELREKG